VKFAAIADWAASAQYPVSFMCAQLGVSRSGYYAWRSAPPSQRSKDDTTLIAVMRELHARVGRGNPARAGCAIETAHGEAGLTAPPSTGHGVAVVQIARMKGQALLGPALHSRAAAA
jgi:hypothetical protein